MNQTEPKEEHGYDLFPERNGAKYEKGSIGQSLFTFQHKCQVMLQFAMETSKCSYHSVTHLKKVPSPPKLNISVESNMGDIFNSVIFNRNCNVYRSGKRLIIVGFSACYQFSPGLSRISFFFFFNLICFYLFFFTTLHIYYFSVMFWVSV